MDRDVLLLMVAEAQGCLFPFYFFFVPFYFFFFFEAVLKILPKTVANQFSLKIIQGIRSHMA